MNQLKSYNLPMHMIDRLEQELIHRMDDSCLLELGNPPFQRNALIISLSTEIRDWYAVADLLGGAPSPTLGEDIEEQCTLSERERTAEEVNAQCALAAWEKKYAELFKNFEALKQVAISLQDKCCQIESELKIAEGTALRWKEKFQQAEARLADQITLRHDEEQHIRQEFDKEINLLNKNWDLTRQQYASLKQFAFKADANYRRELTNLQAQLSTMLKERDDARGELTNEKGITAELRGKLEEALLAIKNLESLLTRREKVAKCNAELLAAFHHTESPEDEELYLEEGE